MDYLILINIPGRQRSDNQNAVVLWFYGPAGAGKTAITHNIAECCDLENLLLAGFFFSCSDPTRSNTKSLIATISYQIAINIPGTREKIVAAIERDPLVLNRSLEAQVSALSNHTKSQSSKSQQLQQCIPQDISQCYFVWNEWNEFEIIHGLVYD